MDERTLARNDTPRIKRSTDKSICAVAKGKELSVYLPSYLRGVYLRFPERARARAQLARPSRTPTNKVARARRGRKDEGWNGRGKKEHGRKRKRSEGRTVREFLTSDAIAQAFPTGCTSAATRMRIPT